MYYKAGERFTNELLPRDLLTKEILKQMEKDQTDYVMLDMRPIGEETIREHFPHIYQHCLEEGFDPTKEPIPIVPAQHYFMGGIKVDRYSKTSMNRLYAAGETSCNGVHGANRLASNSLLESLVFAKRAALHMEGHELKYPVEQETISIDFSLYEDEKQLHDENKKMIFSEIERTRKEHE